MAAPFIARAAQMADKADELMEKVNAAAAANVIFWTAIAFYVPQLTMWAVGMAGIGMEAVPFGDFLFPGKEIFAISLVVIGAIGLCTMAYAAIVFLMRGIDCFGGWKGVIFIGCLTCYLVMFINIFPWFIIWIFSVVLLQEDGGEAE